MYPIFRMYVFISLGCAFSLAIKNNLITKSITSNKSTIEFPFLPSTTILPITDTIITSLTDSSTTAKTTSTTTESSAIGCSCGVFLSGQFKKGSKEPPKGYPSLLHEQPETFPCTNAGKKSCISKCLDSIVKHLPKSSSILCAAIDRNCFRERAHLFIKNCKDEWINTNLSAGREYCCKDGLPYKCPHF